nr:DUF5672 family protein [uncultured Arsenicibacter sp.]
MKKTGKQTVCIVIPVYKTVLTPHESISLTQCFKVLGHFPIKLVHPESLDLTVYRTAFPTLESVPFPDSYFTGIQAYNRLMLSAGFYQAFTGFEYMLIYQLDAFIFKDELLHWCSQGFDYIGAPWLRDRDFHSASDEFIFNLKKRIAILFDLKKEDGVTPREITSLNGVGNGGFSLRRISAFLACLRIFDKKIKQYENSTLYQYNEDAFWGIEVNRYWPRLNIPDFRTALRFAVEFYPQRAITNYNQGELPFGCHAWDIHGTDYWQPIFARYGYVI